MKNKLKLLTILLLVIFLTGCTKVLKDENNKAITNTVTGQNMVENILCKPTNQTNIDLYKDTSVNIDKLPECAEINAFKGKYEGLWTNLIIKPLSHLIISLIKVFKNAGLAIIAVTLLINGLLYPITKKTAMQSENMKKAKPEIDRIEKKYQNKTDNDSMLKKTQEISLIYKKHNISAGVGCLTAFIQIPILFGMIESIQRLPILFEGSFLSMQLGTTLIKGMQTSSFYVYLLLLLTIGFTTYFSFNYMNKDMATNPMMGDDNPMKNMSQIMSVMIIVSALFFPTATGLYWVTSNGFRITQNLLVERKKKNEN